MLRGVLSFAGLPIDQIDHRQGDLQCHQRDDDHIETHHHHGLLSAPLVSLSARALCVRTKVLSIYSFHEITTAPFASKPDTERRVPCAPPGRRVSSDAVTSRMKKIIFINLLYDSWRGRNGGARTPDILKEGSPGRRGRPSSRLRLGHCGERKKCPCRMLAKTVSVFGLLTQCADRSPKRGRPAVAGLAKRSLNHHYRRWFKKPLTSRAASHLIRGIPWASGR